MKDGQRAPAWPAAHVAAHTEGTERGGAERAPNGMAAWRGFWLDKTALADLKSTLAR